MNLLNEANRLAGELAREFKQSLLEASDSNKKTIVAYSGHFQPFHEGHNKVYKTLVQKFGADNVYITTTNQDDDLKNPLSFGDKKQIISKMFHIADSKIYEVDNPYVPKELLKQYNPKNTSFITVVSSDDAAVLSKSKYFHHYVEGQTLDPYSKSAYYLTIPELKLPVGGQQLTDSQLMQVLGSDKTKDETKKKVFAAAFGKHDDEIMDLIKSKTKKSASELDGGFEKTSATGGDNKAKAKKTDASGQDNSTDDKKTKSKIPPMQRMVVNPETGREIKVQSALKYPRWKPVYKKAETFLKTVGVDRKDRVKDPEVNQRYRKRAKNLKKEDLEIMLSNQLSEELLEIARTVGITFDIPNFGTTHLFLENLLTEGGAAGHLSHPYEDFDLTFADLRNMIVKAMSGGLDEEAPVTEKLDGQNIQFSYKNGKVIFARNTGHVKNKGENALDIVGIRDKFAGRGDIEMAFTTTAADLEAAILALSDTERTDMFKDGGKWVNLEIINPKTQNVIPYDKNILVFHNTVEYDDNGDVIKLGQDEGSKIAQMIQHHGAEKQKTYGIQGPQNIAFSDKLSSAYEAKQKEYLNTLDEIRKSAGFSESDTLGDLYMKQWKHYLDVELQKSGLSIENADKESLASRWGSGDKKAMDARAFKKKYPELSTWFADIDKKANNINKNIRKPVEFLFLKVGADSLVRMTNFMSANNPEIADKMKSEVLAALKTIQENPGNASELLQREMERLQHIGFDKITPSEGVVFIYKGKPYKFTGTFAPVNQLMGALKFNRGGGPTPPEDKLYLDDVRPTPDGYNLRAYTAQEAIELLKKGTVSEISFDHDLGPEEAGTGYDVAKWIEEEAYTNPNFKVPKWQIHSANPVGIKNIKTAMESADRGSERLQSTKQKQSPIVVYPGRFQPFHPGHYSVYKGLVDRYGKDNVYIATSNKTDATQSPFDFEEKKRIITSMFDIPEDKVMQVKNPYAPTEILSKYPEDTPYITTVSDKDAQRLAGGGAMGYYQSMPSDPSKISGGYKTTGYVMVAPELKLDVDGENISGTTLRNALSDASKSEQEKQALFAKVYGKHNPDIFNMITSKLSDVKSQEPQRKEKPVTDKDKTKGVSSDVLNQRVKNPETDNDILVKTALGYDQNHPAHKAAEKVINKG